MNEKNNKSYGKYNINGMMIYNAYTKYTYILYINSNMQMH